MEQNLAIARNMLPRITSQTGKNLLDLPEFCLSQSGNIKTFYAPFDHITTNAKLAIVGITPGMTQAVNALNAAFDAQKAGHSLRDTLATAKLAASFSGGAIRNNLVAMLDAIGVNKHLDVPSTKELFQPGSTEVQFTSALRYPVFVGGKNYNGVPNMLATPILREMIETHLAEEARLLTNALWLPLGPKAEAAVNHLVARDALRASRVLAGMPHPSGANAERVAVFLGRKAPEAASRKTNPTPLLEAFNRLTQQIKALEGDAA